MEWVLLALLVLAIPVMAIAGFFMALNARRRIAELEQRLAIMEAGQAAGATTAAATPTTFADDVASVPAEPAAGQQAEPPPVDSAVPPFQPEGADAAPPEPAIAAAVAAPPRQSLEEVIGTRWAVWLGGIALALGGLFLVRFAIEEGFFGPAARVISGALFSLALMAAGEWMRRRDAGGVATTVSLGRLPPAPVPAVLTAAGTLAAFATAYAAHALYDMIGPATAFVLLGAIGIGTMAAAALHGPWLAALGLVAAFVAPLLVSSADPKPWPVVIYLAVVAASAYGLSR
ncbi:MAG: DUF2339 domain-containing protein, partial [Alsobacter sp.]